MDFNERGFLGTAVLEFVSHVEKKYSELFELCYRANELAQAVKHDFKVNNADGQQVLVVTIFVRILNGFQSVVLLARMGLGTDAQVVARGALEALFVLKLLCEDKDFVSEYVKSDKANQLKLFRVAAVSKSPNLSEVRKVATPEAIAKLAKEVDDQNCRAINVEETARRGKLDHLYETEYRLLSLETHASPRAMEKLVEIGRNEEVAGFRTKPTDQDIVMVLTIATETLLIAVESTTKLLGVDVSARIGELGKIWKRLVSESA
jgi:hypothetical protein